MTEGTNPEIAKPFRPLLRWAGSKRQLIPTLLDFVPTTYRTYYEPFLGSGCLFLTIKPSKAVLGDINPELIDTYKIVRDNPKRIAHLVHRMPQTRAFYYELRSMLPGRLKPFLRAARFIYLNRFCFNGVYRRLSGLTHVTFLGRRSVG